MRKTIGLALLVVAMSMTTGCTKNKKRATRLEAELARCQAALQKLESGQLDEAQQAEYAALTCGDKGEMR